MRLRSLDVLRAVAILLVIGRHGPEASPTLHPLAARALDLWHRFGWTGVDLFFVLSGFLISGLLFREWKRHGDIHVGRFFIRRGFKIWPPFYALLILTTVGLFATGDTVLKPLMIPEYLYVQNYFQGVFAHTWSLAVEEQFYLLIGLAFFWTVRRPALRGEPFHFVPRLFPIIALICLGGRLLTSSLHPYEALTHHHPLHLRLDGLAFGVLLGWAYHFRDEAFRAVVLRYWKPILLVSAILISPAVMLDLESSFFMQTVGLTLLYLGFGGFLAVSVIAPLKPGRALETPLNALAWLGVISYSVYLWHWPSAVVVSSLDLSFTPRWFAYAIASIVVGYMATELVETPFLKLRDRRFPSRSGMIERTGSG